MEQSMFTDGELQLTTERRLKYQGTAKINLSQITYHPCVARQLDQKNVERLCEVFRKDGCNRLDVQHHVTALVTRRHLKHARREAQISAEELLTNLPDKYPFLSFPSGQIQCLHGQHRLRAAAEVLAPSERWWTVDLYLDGEIRFIWLNFYLTAFIFNCLSDIYVDISPELRNTLVDEYANEKTPTDGDIYRKIRQYQNEHNAPFQKRWWARLSENKAKRLRQLMSPDNVDICAAFDALLPIPGLWNGLSIGSLNRVLALKCDEVSYHRLPQLSLVFLLMTKEIIHYLQHVEGFWSTLVDGDRHQMAKIDIHTVEKLQLRAPVACSADAREVKGYILSGEVFSHFGETERSEIWNRMSTYDGIIPSIQTFFRDTAYLEACATGVRQFAVLSKNEPTVRAAFKHAYNPATTRGACLVQTSEAGFRSHTGPSTDYFELAYRQIWFFAMRHYPEMAKKATSKKVIAKAVRGRADEVVLHNMATLAQKLGFDSLRVTEMLNRSPDRRIAREALLKARKPGSYRYDPATFDSLIDRLVECFGTAVAHEALPSPELVLGRTPTLSRRCGPPLEHVQPIDRPHLFLDKVHSKEATGQQTISSFFVRQCVYFAFFDKPLTWKQREDHGLASPELLQKDVSRSPLFVPVNDLPSTPRAVPPTESAPQRQSRREHRRERRRRRQETGNHSHRDRRQEIADNMHPAVPADPVDSTTADHDMDMNDVDVAHVVPGGEDISMAGSYSDSRIERDDNSATENELLHDSRRDVEEDPEILSNVEQDEQVLPQGSDTRRNLGDIVHEPSIDSLNGHDTAEEQTNMNEDTASLYSQDSSRSSENASMEYVEPVVPAEMQERLTRGGSSDTDLQLTPSPVEADSKSLKQRTEERESALDAVHQALQALEQEAEKRALTSVEILEEQSLPSTDEPDASSELPSPGVGPAVDALAESRISNENSSATTQDPDPIVRQGRVARSARAISAITQIDLIGLDAATIVGEDGPDQQEQTESPILGQAAVSTPFGHQKSSDHEQGTDNTGPREILGDLSESSASTPIIVESTGPPRPAALHNRAGATGEGGPSQREQADFQTTHHDMAPLVSKPQEPKEHVQQTNKKKLRENKDDPQEAPASGQNLSEFTVPLLPEALRPRRNPPPNAITITFKVYDNGGWHVTDQVPVNPNDPSEADRIAHKYARKDNKDARFYNKNLRLVSAAQCVRAAMDDGSNTVLMSLQQDLVVTRAKVTAVAEMMKTDAQGKAATDADDRIT
ncbi:hypothetical protein HAV15_003280 [Penicillium sp. str. |nr:hypothetical protein HAV15_003280 [Penicillium sp. str. \